MPSIRGAIINGLSDIEIREAILQVSVYCGMPAGLEGFKVAERVINEMIAAGEYVSAAAKEEVKR